MVLDGYDDDELSAEEEKIFQQHERSAEVPPAEDDDDKPIAPEQVAAEQGVDKKPEGQQEQQPGTAEADQGQSQEQQPAGDEDAEFKAFAEKHAGKSPEEILKLAYQQTARSSRLAYDLRQRQEQADANAKRAQERLQEIREAAAKRRQDLTQRLADDPDAVTRELVEGRLSEEEEAAEIAAYNAQVEAAETFAESRIPNYREQKPLLYRFATEEFGYPPERLNQITDGRDLVVLQLASVAGRLIKGGLMDINGRFLQPIGAVAENPKDPRLQGTGKDDVRTLSSAPARTGNAGKSDMQALQDLANMSEEELAAIPDAEIERLLRNVA